ncbi:hypothetical protein AB0C18_33080 [Nonomuraea muscovyensis]|uniref:hypothetical protein n=1 Tax=Nonomuraea muscovyensis TaxID=1124761 RepID=UPI0033EE6AA7|nr:hypothetical protein [Nonomuraea muscovyensis]
MGVNQAVHGVGITPQKSGALRRDAVHPQHIDDLCSAVSGRLLDACASAGKRHE